MNDFDINSYSHFKTPNLIMYNLENVKIHLRLKNSP